MNLDPGNWHRYVSGRDALVVWPTDRGKSLVYQLPAIHTGKLVVVIEPNISLMDNQVPRPLACAAAASHHPSLLYAAIDATPRAADTPFSALRMFMSSLC